MKRSIRKNRTGILFGTRASFCLAAVLLLLFSAVRAAGDTAAETAAQRADYYAVMYDNTNGMPTSEANAVVQTTEGFIWIGSYGGLIRYDGNTFELTDPRTGIDSVKSLLVDSRNRLWIGTNDNGLAMMENGELRFWTEEDGLGSSMVGAIAEAPDGAIYVGTTNIVMITGDMAVHPVDAPQLGNDFVEELKPAADGSICGLTNEDDYFLLKDGELADYINHYETIIEGITCVLPDPNDPEKLYIGTEKSMLYHCGARDLPIARDSVDISPLTGVNDICIQGDRIWICATNGIGALENGEFHCFTDLPMNTSIQQMMTDYQGNQWFASNRHGVMKVVTSRFTNVFKQYDIPQSVVNSTCMCEGKLFVGTDAGLVVIDENGPVSRIPLTEAKTVSGHDLKSDDLVELLEGSRIRSVIRDSKQRLWFSTWRNKGLVCYDGEKVLVFTEDDGLCSDQVRTVCEDAEGTVYVVCTGGVNVIRDGSVAGTIGQEEGIANSEILTACAAPNGDVLVGANGDGIYIIRDGKVIQRLGKEDGLTSGVVMRIKPDASNDGFWVVTGSFISHVSPDYQVKTLKNMPYSNNFDIYENSRGDAWILSSSGIYVAQTSDLLAGKEVKPVHFGVSSGLPFITTSNSYSELTSEGDLYMSGNAGVAKVNIDAPPEDVTNLKQGIPCIEADGEILYPSETGGFYIPADTKKLTVYGYVFNYSLGDPTVSYQLFGFDQEPVSINCSELLPVSYTNLPGGSYRFSLTLRSTLGSEIKTMSVSIVKEKTLFEQVWFYGILILGGSMLLVLLSRNYWKQKIIALEKKHKEEAERQSIMDELNMAAKIQDSMLPRAFPDRKEFDLYASMNPAKEVGGDFYDFFMIDDDHLGMVIADVSGKGIPAAMFMTVSKSLIKTQLMSGCDPAEALKRANLQICDQNQSMMFVTVWLAVLEISTGRGIACNAGHENPGICRAGQGFELLKYKHNMVVGVMEMAKYKNREFELHPGDGLFVYTDGVPEAENADHGMFGEDSLIETLNIDASADPETLIRRVHEAVDRFAEGTPQFDDITMLCLKYHGAQKDADE